MRKLSTYVVVLAFVPAWACAGAQADDGDGSGGSGSATGGTGQVGSGGAGNTGGISGSTGGAASTGGTSSTGGGASTGGATNTGGSASSGGASSGGASSGGSSSGGAGSGGAPPYEGDCADKPTFDDWGEDQQTMEDNYEANVPIVYVCPKVQSSCTAEMLGEPYLFECVSHHANNCATQKPDDASSWAAIDSCANLGFGGMGGMGGGGP